MVLIPACFRQPRRLIVVLVMASILLSAVTVVFHTSAHMRSNLDHLTYASGKTAKHIFHKLISPPHRKYEHALRLKDQTRQKIKTKNTLEGRKEPDKPERKKEEHIVTKKEPDDVAQVFAARRSGYQKVCRDWKRKMGMPIPGTVRPPYLFSPANFSYCGVPKVGITFWKRIFYYLFNKTVKKTKRELDSPMDVDRFFVHSHSAGSRVDMTSTESKRLLSTAHRVMFSRDPWSRLWSAYVDKFILPDSWLDHGRSLAKMRNNLSASEAKTLKSQSALERRVAESENSAWAFHSKDKTKCPDDVTFAEFLRYAVTSRNAHWSPVHGVCNPCVFKPQFVGKMETFGRDTDYILKTAGLSDSVKLPMNHSDHVLDELEQLTLYHYDHYRRLQTSFESCLDKLGVARRLWRAFQLNGYISPGDKFPDVQVYGGLQNLTWPDLGSYVVELVQAAHSARPLSHQEWSALKRRNMVGAYRSVPRELLYKMQEKFHLDFELFRYDKQPKDIFGP